MMIVLAVAHTAAAQILDSEAYDSYTAARAGQQAVSKVKTSTPTALKVKPFSSISSGFQAISRYNPATWGFNCSLPSPLKGQFLLGPGVWFARVQGDMRRSTDTTRFRSTVVDFNDHLGLRKSGNVIWSLDALYQFRPRWAVRYTFTPFTLEGSGAPRSSFEFGGQPFDANTIINSKWQRSEHRFGIIFNLSRTRNGMTSLFADWMYIQDKISVGSTAATAQAVSWDEDKNLALVGIEFDRCLKNYKGNTLALNLKGGVAFLDDTIGYEAEAALNYMIPIRTGRFGFLKGGYRYSHLKKETDTRMFNTTLDGGFLQMGFIF